MTTATAGMKTTLAFVTARWRRQGLLALALMLAVTAETIIEVIVPVFAGRLIDAATDLTRDRNLQLEAALSALAAMTGAGLAMLVLRFVIIKGVVRFTLAMMSTVAAEGFWRVQRFSSDWHANNFGGATVRKVSRGMGALDLLNDTIMLALWPSALVLVFTTALVAWRWPLMGLVVALGSIAYVAVAALLAMRYVAPVARKSNQWDSRLSGALADAIGCNAVVKSFSGEAREDARVGRIITRWKARTAVTWGRLNVNGAVQQLMMVILQLVVVGFAVGHWWRGEATAGDLAYVLAAYTIVGGYLRDVGYHLRNFQRSINELDELVALDREPLGVEDRADAEAITVPRGRIDFEKVAFQYPAHGRHVYDELSVTIPAGQRVGLVGRSGSGKTTFVKLVQRLYDVTGGRIVIDGHDIAAATQASLRRSIAVVQQEPVLFHRSLAENIAYARPGAATAEIERAARLANAHDFVTALPHGYATVVGERGTKLSGGERQRIALARAFLADAPILILDEATSALDSESEALVQAAMERLMQGRTTLVIAHRLSTVRALDRILVFDNGRVVEDGDHRRLMERDGVYRGLVERQSEDGRIELKVA